MENAVIPPLSLSLYLSISLFPPPTSFPLVFSVLQVCSIDRFVEMPLKLARLTQITELGGDAIGVRKKNVRANLIIVCVSTVL